MSDVKWRQRHDRLCDRIRSVLSLTEEITAGADLDDIEDSLGRLETAIETAEEEAQEENDEESNEDEEDDKEDDEE